MSVKNDVSCETGRNGKKQVNAYIRSYWKLWTLLVVIPLISCVTMTKSTSILILSDLHAPRLFAVLILTLTSPAFTLLTCRGSSFMFAFEYTCCGRPLLTSWISPPGSNYMLLSCFWMLSNFQACISRLSHDHSYTSCYFDNAYVTDPSCVFTPWPKTH